MALPLLHLHGDPYQQGVQHGRQAARLIVHNLDLYFHRFREEAGLSREEVLRRGAAYSDYLAVEQPDYWAGVQGVAEGSGCDLAEVAALNVRYEILYHEFNSLPPANGCTTIAVLPEWTANGHLLLGQNWDWIPGVRGVVLHSVEPDGLEVLSFSEAGIVGGKIGLTSAGIGLGVNGLCSSADNWARLGAPFHARCYQILRARELDAAVQAASSGVRACSSNFLIAQAPGHVTDVEAAPEFVHLADATEGYLAHTNHFLEPERFGVIEPDSAWRAESGDRLDRVRQLLGDGRLTPDDLRRILQDHRSQPTSICRHPDPEEPPAHQYATVASVVMDLHARTLDAADGPPCSRPYHRARLDP